jgi:hypothetical protein
MDLPVTPLVPENALATIKLPSPSNFRMKVPKIAEVKVVVAAPGSKSTVPTKVPVVKTFPEISVVAELPTSAPVLPILFAQIKLPALLNLVIKISSPP